MEYQNTLANECQISGIGTHSGTISNMRIIPAAVDHGIIFKRTDLQSNDEIKACYSNVINTTMCTVIGNDRGMRVSTIEHIMAAFWGCKIDNALIEIDSDEVPIMDGSCKHFVQKINETGINRQNKPTSILKILQPVDITYKDKSISIQPSDSFSIDFDISYDNSTIGQQSYRYNEHSVFNRDIYNARTYGFIDDLQNLQKMSLAKGASLDNAVGIDKVKDEVLNPEGLRYNDEFVRHKILDCIGDFYLSGYRIIHGKIKACKSGHKINNMLLKKLFADKAVQVLPHG